MDQYSNQLAQGSGGSLQGLQAGIQAVPQEPDLVTKAAQCARYLSNAEVEVSIIRGTLFGEGESKPLANGTAPVCLAATLADLSQRLASLVGQLTTVNGRLERKPTQSNNINTANQQFRAGSL
jgi:hypothetical protein